MTDDDERELSYGVLDEGLYFDEEDFDPLQAPDDEYDPEQIDDDNPYDTVDYPYMRNMPQSMQREAVYSPQSAGSAYAALDAMMDHNPARRADMLAVLGMCQGGCASSKIASALEERNADNRSVYAPMTYCRMLERAGGLRLEMPPTSEEHEDWEEGVEYLEIRETIDPLWYTTEAGSAIYAEQTSGAAFKDIVLDRDSTYIEVYSALLEELSQYPMTRVEIDELAEEFPITKSPRRYGSHFIDMLERVYAIEWRDHAWTITELGRAMLPSARLLAQQRSEQALKEAAASGEAAQTSKEVL
ncbi:MAG: hypothetical protein ACI36Y_06855 [Coriobacteriales bacterium]